MANIKISLAAARINKEMTQDEVAKYLKVSKHTVLDWEKGRKEPTINQALIISNLYELPLDAIIFLPKSPTKSEIA